MTVVDINIEADVFSILIIHVFANLFQSFQQIRNILTAETNDGIYIVRIESQRFLIVFLLFSPIS